MRDRFVAVRVDADRRPDISERYTLGGWPTTAFLTADGGFQSGDWAMGTRIGQYMVFDEENPNSLWNCVTRARENARGIRENISAEMWECIHLF